MSKKEEKPKSKDNKKVGKDSEKPTEANQVKLGVFEEDDYFEEFEVDANPLNRRDTGDFRQWQEAWEDEEINDNFEDVLRKEIEATKTK